ncbi:prephenate dehydrogenase [Flavobacterium sp.]|uniref:prephenate dehydrogenase n=1 Tax=Flavobacterium sp. TaxID=239 RepID=UPI003341EBA8
MKVAVIGIGLIGGSLARDIRFIWDQAEIVGLDAYAGHVQQAIELGLVNREGQWEEIPQMDMVIVSVPVDKALSVVPQVLDLVNENTLVLDVGSTKQPLCEAVQHHPNRRNFLATHPIAGTEFSGPKAALKGLFEGKTNIICEVEKTAFGLQVRAMALFRKLGMRIRYMDPNAHDRHIAYVSHLSHISSFMLGKTVIEKERDERDIFDMAGSGFESTVRLAKSSPDMWTPIFNQNKANVLATLEEYIRNLSRFRELLETEQYDALYQEMQHTNRIKEILNGIKK